MTEKGENLPRDEPKTLWKVIIQPDGMVVLSPKQCLDNVLDIYSDAFQNKMVNGTSYHARTMPTDSATVAAFRLEKDNSGHVSLWDLEHRVYLAFGRNGDGVYGEPFTDSNSWLVFDPPLPGDQVEYNVEVDHRLERQTETIVAYAVAGILIITVLCLIVCCVCCGSAAK